MFSGCTGIRVSDTQSDEYNIEWRIPSTGTIISAATAWNTSMLGFTSGPYTGNPTINTTYYLYGRLNPPIIVPPTEGRVNPSTGIDA